MNMHNEDNFTDKIMNFFKQIHALDRIPRAGFLLRGVTEPESVSAHSHFLSLLAVLFLDEYPQGYDREKVVIMALVHDLPEAFSMDIPMPVADEVFGRAKKTLELKLFRNLFDSFDHKFIEYYEEFAAKKTAEAKLVAALDKLQMIIKIVSYEKENRGCLTEFWGNEANFRSYGIREIEKIFHRLREMKTSGC